MEELMRQPSHTRELFVRAAREYCQNNSIELEFCSRQIQASIKIGDLQAQNLNKLINVQGLLIGSSRTRPKPQKVVLICRACGHRLEMEQQFGQQQINIPTRCQRQRGAQDEPCPPRSYQIAMQESTYTD